jgi:hypothetical protein
MKPLRPRCLFALAALLTFEPLAWGDDQASHKAAADELLQTMHSETSLDRVTDQMTRSAERMALPGANSATPPEVAAFRDSLRKESAGIIKEQLNWATFEPQVAQLYVDTFTEPELKSLTEFYKTPIGQKLVSTQNDLAGKITVLTQQKIRAAFAVLTAKLRESSAKFRAGHPPIPSLIAAPPPTPARPSPSPSAAAPAVPAPASPTASPASPAPQG